MLPTCKFSDYLYKQQVFIKINILLETWHTGILILTVSSFDIFKIF